MRDALAVLPRFADDLEVTVIDDGSTDRTGSIADDLAKSDPRVHVVHHGKRRGYGGAVRSGLVSATKEFIFFTDGDRQFALTDLERLIDRIDGVDAVMGYRLKRQDPARARFVAFVYNNVIRVLFLGGFRDVDCAFKLFRREVFQTSAAGTCSLKRRVLLGRAADHAAARRHQDARGRRASLPPDRWARRKGQQPKVILRAIRDLLRLRLRLWGLPL